MSRLVLVLALALSLSALACGSDDEDSGSDQEQLQALYDDYLTAIGEGDAATACEQLTEESQEATAANFDSCEQALESAAGFDEGDFGKVRLTRIKIDDDVATAQATTNFGSQPVRFEQTDDGWRLAPGG
jgi:hypothetical protein